MKNKIVSLQTVKRRIAALRKKKKKIVFTNGCFDILHFGHVSYLQEAKKQGDVLVLGLNSDASVHLIKGKKRPIVPQKQRAHVLAALECIDLIVLFDEDTPYNLIKAVKPDVLVKGADWKGKKVAGSDVVKEHGGKMKYLAFVKGCSTTSIINSILKKCS